MAKPVTNSRLRKVLKKVTEPQTGWLDVFPAILGRADGTVLSGVNGVVYVRNILNGQLLSVYNSAVPNIPLLQVEVGRRVDTPGLWQVKGTIEAYDVPSASSSGGSVADHHEQHEFPNNDTVWVDPKQILRLSVLVNDASSFIVTVIGSVIRTTSGISQINTQSVDLSSYIPAAGAVFVTIQADDDGVLTVVEGTVFGSPLTGTFADVPAADADKYMIAFVLLHESMTELSNDDIRIPFLFHGGGTTFVNWGDITGTLSDQTDLQAALDAKADEDHSHESSHVHGLARWNGASSQTTFDLPDIWEYIDSLMLNGLEEDPLVYSLSADGLQIVLDTALSTATTVTAHGVIAGV